MTENERIAGANKSQPLDKGWGRRGNLGFPTDDRIFRNGMTENERIAFATAIGGGGGICMIPP
jgi:hypothetical protein